MDQWIENLDHSRFRDIVELAVGTRTAEDLHRLLSELCRTFEFDHFILVRLTPSSLANRQIPVVSGYPPDWWSHYLSSDYPTVDPAVAHCITRADPLVWSDIQYATDDDARRRRRVMLEAREFGLCSGATFPVHGRNGELTICSLASTLDGTAARTLIARALPYAQLLTTYLSESARRIFSSESIRLSADTLSAREKDCLLWAAEGKTAWETSRILGISERTVHFHIRNAATKLGVSKRSQAIARAISLSLITPQFD